MRRIDLNSFDWVKAQQLFDAYDDDSLSKLGIKQRTIYQAIEHGLLNKRPAKPKTQEWKDNVAKGRKNWLAKNPDKHPWKKSTKFKSIPCEKLKESLRSNNINFIEEYSILTYSIDIAIPEKRIAIEVNGNQHYSKTGQLLPYYQSRHDLIKDLGWTVFEIHYTSCFNVFQIHSIINFINTSVQFKPFDYSEYFNEKSKVSNPPKLREQNKINYETEVKKKLEDALIKVDISKFGWVQKVADLTGYKSQKIRKLVQRVLPDVYKKSFRRS
jgi:very-short-patch-repair endonuclease